MEFSSKNCVHASLQTLYRHNVKLDCCDKKVSNERKKQLYKLLEFFVANYNISFTLKISL